METSQNKDHLKNVTVLIQLGTPETLSKKSVAGFIRSFLLDPRVIEMPSLLRHLLVRMIIVPFRAKKSLGRYQQIWDPVNGSPLQYHSAGVDGEIGREGGTRDGNQISLSAWQTPFTGCAERSATIGSAQHSY
jgi:hypothetical protein